jgi:glyoxylase-like metal-dependent hydrolase (beta-lactamase superfamily II)
MNAEVYRFNVGDFECLAVSDGTFTYAPPLIPPPAAFLFTNVPKELLDQTLRNHDIQPKQWMEYATPYTCLMVNTGRHKVLVDTGADGLTPNTGRLLLNLQAVGIRTSDIDTVILTHGHDDHIGGNTDAQGKSTFPKARYVMWKEEWTFWTSEQAEKLYEKSELANTRRKLLPIRHQLDLLEHEAEIVPGITAIATPGHTFGHMAVDIFSKGEHLLCVSDAFLHPIHIEHPEWHAAHEVDPEQLLKTRHLLLKKATTENTLMLAFHFPFPGLGHVVRQGTGWQWQPIQSLA